MTPISLRTSQLQNTRAQRSFQYPSNFGSLVFFGTSSTRRADVMAQALGPSGATRHRLARPCHHHHHRRRLPFGLFARVLKLTLNVRVHRNGLVRWDDGDVA